MTKIEQEDHEKKGRFVVYENDVFAGEMTYTWAGKTKFIIDHTMVDEKFGGKGFGKLLVMKSVEFAQKNDLKILPLCSYAQKIFDKNEELKELMYD
ncbi:N-acetyltransferase [Maribacter sp. ANRC-HE7]|uniref:N-acetyltransferase n=1 Tax=Maribacter aquimaris TaxID=2737171 RepID=A0ABR7V295_9FLAO|nr:GNAT family N-acetyltransferase [Maribacter aquimaris]MBD0778721.1 N-acetyltransferase [Maribacter aquimaris]